MDFIHVIVIKVLPENSKLIIIISNFSHFSLVVKLISMNVHHPPVQTMVLVLIKSMVTHVIVRVDI
jgi:hypothetical protein